uniref:Uncharacterized protein n=1 Tax=Anguilla anguilla TaxID=7936 RepID=A0A0E9Q1M6_ANGAN
MFIKVLYIINEVFVITCFVFLSVTKTKTNAPVTCTDAYIITVCVHVTPPLTKKAPE